MKYFSKENDLKFFKTPNKFDKKTPKDILKYAIGANMYIPATHENIFEKIITGKFNDIGTITLCMEDSITEGQLENAEQVIINFLQQISELKIEDFNKKFPLIFIRIRNAEHFKKFSAKLKTEYLKYICGFTFPKFNSDNGKDYLNILEEVNQKSDDIIYGMPIIEDKKVIYKESRFKELDLIQKILLQFNKYILNIRIGATDFSSLFGLRRDINYTIYDIKVVSDCLMDILNSFTRSECQYVISGPVWEYYSWEEDSLEIKNLKKELNLDIQNGFHGKTVIHPSQVDVINKSYIVKYEDFIDASNILKTDGGVFSGYKGNRMNEVNPHRNWAKKILAKAEIFGVANINTRI